MGHDRHSTGTCAVLRGVICLLKVVDGMLKKGDRVVAASTEETYDVLEVNANACCITPQ